MSLLMSYTRCLYLVTVVYCLSQPVLLTLVVFHPCVSPACAVLVISCVILFYFTLHLLAFAAIGLFTTILLSDPCSVIQSTSTVYIIPRGAAYHQAKVATASGPQARFCMCVCVCVRGSAPPDSPCTWWASKQTLWQQQKPQHEN